MLLVRQSRGAFNFSVYSLHLELFCPPSCLPSHVSFCSVFDFDAAAGCNCADGYTVRQPFGAGIMGKYRLHEACRPRSRFSHQTRLRGQPTLQQLQTLPCLPPRRLVCRYGSGCFNTDSHLHPANTFCCSLVERRTRARLQTSDSVISNVRLANTAKPLHAHAGLQP